MLVFSVKYLNSAPHQKSLCREVMLKLCFWSHTKVDLKLYWIWKDFWGRSDGREGSLRDEIKKFTHRTWMKAEENVSITPTSQICNSKITKTSQGNKLSSRIWTFFFSFFFYISPNLLLLPDAWYRVSCCYIYQTAIPPSHPPPTLTYVAHILPPNTIRKIFHYFWSVGYCYLKSGLEK